MNHLVYGRENVHISSYANLVLLTKVYARLEQRRWRRARAAFLTEQLKLHGKLICHYCGRNDLIIGAQKRSLRATVDHVIPRSRGGNEFNSDNFVVCCNSCNKKKANESAEQFKCSKYIQDKKKLS